MKRKMGGEGGARRGRNKGNKRRHGIHILKMSLRVFTPVI